MKPYEKPKIVALSLSGNEALCGSCADKYTLVDDTTGLAAYLMHMFDFGTGEPDRSDFENVFGAGDMVNGINPCTDHQIVGFCKFTSTGQMVAWS